MENASSSSSAAAARAWSAGGEGPVVFIRHANTCSAAEAGGDDFARTLSDKGHEQCKAGLERTAPALAAPPLGMRENPVVVSSSAGRCIETARRMLGGAPRVIACSALYDGTCQPECSALFARHGYAPLRPYLADAEGAALLDAYATKALDEVALLMGRADAEKAAGEPWVICCHAVYTNRLALALGQALGLPAAQCDVPLDTNLQETDGFVVSEAGIARLSDVAAAHWEREGGGAGASSA